MTYFNSDTVFWILSTMTQSLAALIGLMLVAYIRYDDAWRTAVDAAKRGSLPISKFMHDTLVSQYTRYRWIIVAGGLSLAWNILGMLVLTNDYLFSFCVLWYLAVVIAIVHLFYQMLTGRIGEIDRHPTTEDKPDE